MNSKSNIVIFTLEIHGIAEPSSWTLVCGRGGLGRMADKEEDAPDGTFKRNQFSFIFIYCTQLSPYVVNTSSEKALCYSENRKLRWWDQENLGTQFSRRKTGKNCQKNTITSYPVYSKQTTIPSILLSGAKLTEYYSVHSGIRIGPKRTQLLLIPCILNLEQNAPIVLRWCVQDWYAKELQDFLCWSFLRVEYCKKRVDFCLSPVLNLTKLT